MAGDQTLSVYAIDSNGCFGQSDQVAISNPTPIGVGFAWNEVSPVVDATCEGTADGLAYLAAFGGNAPSTIEFSVDGENFGPSPLTLGTGEYEVVAMDINGCLGFLGNSIVIEAQYENCGCLDSLFVTMTNLSSTMGRALRIALVLRFPSRATMILLRTLMTVPVSFIVLAVPTRRLEISIRKPFKADGSCEFPEIVGVV